MKKRILTLLLTITALITAVFGVTACSSVEFKVNFVVDGEVYATVNTNGAETIKMPENPTKQDHVFDGWYWDEGVWQKPFTANSLLDAPLSSDMSIYCKWKATVPSVETVTLDKTELTMYKNDVVNLIATVTPNGAKQDVVWSSSNMSVATVENGTVTAVSIGTATITVATVDGNKTATCTLEVLEDSIAFKTLTVEDETVYGKVSNATETFSFIKEVEERGNAIYQVYKELTCETLIPSKSIALEVGDNTVYILQTIGNDLKLYTVTIRRRPIYEVTFNTNGGAEVESQMVEEDAVIEAPTTTKEGYTLSGWSYDFATPISSSVIIEANWVANSYTIVCDVNGGNALATNEQIVTYNSAYKLEVPTKEGHTFKGWYGNDYYNTNIKYTNEQGESVENFVITKNLSLKAEWDVNNYIVTLKGDEDKLSFDSNDETRYGNEVILYATVFDGYVFDGWYNEDEELLSKEKKYSFILGANNVEFTAKCVVAEEMKNFEFESTESSCKITGIKDKDLEKIVVPNYVTAFSSGVFSGCSNVKELIIPFVGLNKEGTYTNGNRNYYPLGVLFGTIEYDGATKTNQTYMREKDAYTKEYIKTNYYIPDSLTKVVVDYNIYFGAFSNCSNIINVPIGKETSFSVGAFIDSAISNFEVSGENNNYIAIDDVVYSKDKTRLLCYAPNKTETTFTFPDGVNEVGAYAFYNQKNLQSVIFSDNVEILGKYSFEGCTSIDLKMGKNVKEIGEGAFLGCKNIKELLLYNVAHIGKYAFKDCSGLQRLAFSENYGVNGVLVDSYAFQYCNIKFLYIGQSKIYLFKDAFTNASVKFAVGSKRSTFYSYGGRYAYSVGGYEGKIVAESVYQHIDDYDFAKLHDDGQIYLYGGHYNSSYYYEPKSLLGYIYDTKKFEVLDGVPTIGTSAFKEIINLEELTIPSSVTSIGSSAFANCDSLTKVNYLGTIDEWVQIKFSDYHSNPLCYAKNLYINNELVTEANITTATKINDYAFYNYTGLTSVTIGNGVASIRDYAFEGCSNLTKVNYLGTIDEWVQIGFVNSYSNPLYYAKNLYINNELVTEANITTATEISARAFSNCTSLTSVTIGNSVTSIGNSAFSGCDSLTNVTIGESVTSIGYRAFSDCSSLQSITIPNSVKSIESSVFSGCSSLESMTLPFVYSHFGYIFGASSCGYNNVYVPSSLKNVTIIDGSSICAKAFYNCDFLHNVTIGKSVTSMGDDAFYNCDNLTKVNYLGTIDEWAQIEFESLDSNPLYNGAELYINNELVTELNITTATKINNYAFYNCDFIQSLTIGNDVTSIGDRAFYDCLSLASVEMLNSVTNIGAYAFYNCPSLAIIELPNSVTNIGDYAFSGCSSLTIAIIGGGAIGHNAFYGCNNLTDVTIGERVKSIGYHAFYSCERLTYVDFIYEERWYHTDNFENWQNKTGGTAIGVRYAGTCATYFKSSYKDYYWYNNWV